MKKAILTVVSAAALVFAVVAGAGAQSVALQYKFYSNEGKISAVDSGSFTVAFNEYFPCPIPMMQGAPATSGAASLRVLKCSPCIEPMATTNGVATSPAYVGSGNTSSDILPNIYPPKLPICDEPIKGASRAPATVVFQNILVLDQGDQVLTSITDLKVGDVVRVYWNGDSVYMVKRLHSILCGGYGVVCPRPIPPIIRIQQELKDRGFFPLNVSTTGTIGPITKKAILDFQAKNSIPQTGTAGPLTLKALGISE